jgi:hypothetical protein
LDLLKNVVSGSAPLKKMDDPVTSSDALNVGFQKGLLAVTQQRLNRNDSVFG